MTYPVFHPFVFMITWRGNNVYYHSYVIAESIVWSGIYKWLSYLGSVRKSMNPDKKSSVLSLIINRLLLSSTTYSNITQPFHKMLGHINCTNKPFSYHFTKVQWYFILIHYIPGVTLTCPLAVIDVNLEPEGFYMALPEMGYDSMIASHGQTCGS